MTREEFETIIKLSADLKNQPNSKLIEYMDMLTNDFETTKNNIINMTIYMDKVEELYNNLLKEYQSRSNG
jgi:hypothetical protein